MFPENEEQRRLGQAARTPLASPSNYIEMPPAQEPALINQPELAAPAVNTRPRYQQPAQPSATQNTSLLGDVGSALGAGSGVVGQAATGLFDYLTAGKTRETQKKYLGQALGESMADVSKGYRDDYSPETQRQQQAANQGEGFFGTIGSYLQNPRALGMGLVESAPSMVAAGPILRGAGALGGTAYSAGFGAGISGADAQQRILSMPDEQLAQSPEYQKLLAGGSNPSQARELLAKKAMDTTAPIAGAISGLAGRLVAPFEASVARGQLGKMGAKAFAGNLGKEFAEEAIQEGGEQYASNVGVGQVDESQAAFEGVSEAAGAGAVTGLASGAALQTPQLIADQIAKKKAKGEPLNEEEQTFETEQLALPPGSGSTQQYALPDGSALDMTPDEFNQWAQETVDTAGVSKEEQAGAIERLRSQMLSVDSEPSESDAPAVDDTAGAMSTETEPTTESGEIIPNAVDNIPAEMLAPVSNESETSAVSNGESKTDALRQQLQQYESELDQAEESYKEAKEGRAPQEELKRLRLEENRARQKQWQTRKELKETGEDVSQTSVTEKPSQTTESPAFAEQPAQIQTQADANPVIEPKGSRTKIVTPKGDEEFEAGYDIVEAADLITSHNVTGDANPSYPQELQPRDRGQSTSGAQIRDIANKLDPERVGESRDTSAGAPIVGNADNVVEQGNGRGEGIRQAYFQGNGDNYKQWLGSNAQKFGVDGDSIAGMQQPVLVRRRLDSRDMNERADFARRAGMSATAATNATEDALVDAKTITPQMLERLAPSNNGDMLSASNNDFMQQFAQVVGGGDISRMQENGQWSRQAGERAKAAVFHAAYGDKNLTSQLATSADPEFKNIQTAMLQVAPQFAKMKAKDPTFADGRLDLIKPLAAAVDTVSKSRRDNTPVRDLVNQDDIFNQMEPAQAALATFIDENIRSSVRMSAGIKALADFVDTEMKGAESVGLFGESNVDLGDIIQAASNQIGQYYENRSEPTDIGFVAEPGSGYQTGPESEENQRSTNVRADDSGGRSSGKTEPQYNLFGFEPEKVKRQRKAGGKNLDQQPAIQLSLFDDLPSIEEVEAEVSKSKKAKQGRVVETASSQEDLLSEAQSTDSFSRSKTDLASSEPAQKKGENSVSDNEQGQALDTPSLSSKFRASTGYGLAQLEKVQGRTKSKESLVTPNKNIRLLESQTKAFESMTDKLAGLDNIDDINKIGTQRRDMVTQYNKDVKGAVKSTEFVDARKARNKAEKGFMSALRGKKVEFLNNSSGKPQAKKAVVSAEKMQEETGAIDSIANEAATSPANNTPEPTRAQKEAGNYKLGHLSLHGFDISIENPKGSERKGTDRDGKEWSVEMAHHYGYIRSFTPSRGSSGSNKNLSQIAIANSKLNGDTSNASAGRSQPVDSSKVITGSVSSVRDFDPAFFKSLENGPLTDADFSSNLGFVESIRKKIKSFVDIPSKSVNGGSANASLDKAVSNNAAAYAKLFGDSVDSHSLLTKGYNSLDIDRQRMVQSSVLSALHERKVFDSVVKLIPIDVVNSLIGRQVSTDEIRNNPSVFLDRFSAALNNTVRISVGRVIDSISSGLPVAFASRVAKEISAPFNPPSVSLKSIPAVRTINNIQGESPSESKAYYNTKGKDGDHIDVFLGPDAENENAPIFVIDQVNVDSKRFDEHKVMVGFSDEEAAKKGYLDNYEKGWQGLGDITETTVDGLKSWFSDGDTTKRFTTHSSNESPVVDETKVTAENTAESQEGKPLKLTKAEENRITQAGMKAVQGIRLPKLERNREAYRKAAQQRDNIQELAEKGERQKILLERESKADVDREKAVKDAGLEISQTDDLFKVSGDVYANRGMLKNAGGEFKEGGFEFKEDPTEIIENSVTDSNEIADKANPDTYKSDIPFDLAKRAHDGSSFSPEKRAEQEINGYADTMANDYENLLKIAKTEEQKMILDSSFSGYRNRYKDKVIARLGADSRTMSTMITGPANFPTRSNNKKLDTAHKRLTEQVEFREAALKRIKKDLIPRENQPVKTGDSDAVSVLRKKLEEAETRQTNIREANKNIRKKLKGLSDDDDAPRRALIKELSDMGFSNRDIKIALVPERGSKPSFPSYMLTNNGAEVRRLKDRLTAAETYQVESEDEGGIKSIAFDGGSLEYHYSDNRVRILYEDKPSADIIKELKSNGFKWSRQNSAWQRQLTNAAKYQAKKITGAKEDAGVSEPSATYEITPQIETPAFKKWFGDSQIIDDDGKPLVVYHGTSADFDVFESQALVTKKDTDLGFHFGTIDQATEFTEDSRTEKLMDSGNIMPLYLSIKNPLRMPDLFGDDLDYAEKTVNHLQRKKIISKDEKSSVLDGAEGSKVAHERLIDLLEKKGYDGIVYANKKEGEPIVIPAGIELNGELPKGFSVIENEDGDFEVIDPSGVVQVDGVTADKATAAAINDIEKFGYEYRKDSYIAFRPEQIKSAVGNSGTFDASNPSIVAEPKRKYGNREGQTDLFAPGDESLITVMIPESQEITVDPGRSRDSEPAMTEPANDVKAEFYAQVEQVPVMSFQSPIDTVKSPEDVAASMRDLGMMAQENMVAVVTDKDGKILNVVRHSIGTQNNANVSAGLLAGAVFDTPKAANVWFAHNHPSGNAKQSDADAVMTDLLTDLIKGNGIDVHGMTVVTPTKEASYAATLDDSVPITPSEQNKNLSKKLNVTESRIVKISNKSPITNVESAKKATPRNKDGSLKSGILLLDNKLSPSGFVEMSINDMEKLRQGSSSKGAGKMLSSRFKAGANGAIIVAPGDPSKVLIGAKNVVRALNSTGDTQVFDILSGDDDVVSFAQNETDGYQIDMSETGVYYSKAATKSIRNLAQSAKPKNNITNARRELYIKFGKATVDRLEKNGALTIVDNPRSSSVPDNLKQALNSFDGQYQTQGLYDPISKQTFLFSHNIKPGKVSGVALHEMVHKGFKDLVGKETYKEIMDSIGDRVSKGVKPGTQDARFSQAFDSLPPGMYRQYYNAATDQGATHDIANKYASDVVKDETLAYFVEQNPNHSITRQVIAAIKLFIRKDLGIKMEFSNDELVALATASLRRTSRMKKLKLDIGLENVL